MGHLGAIPEKICTPPLKMVPKFCTLNKKCTKLGQFLIFLTWKPKIAPNIVPLRSKTAQKMPQNHTKMDIFWICCGYDTLLVPPSRTRLAVTASTPSGYSLWHSTVPPVHHRDQYICPINLCTASNSLNAWTTTQHSQIVLKDGIFLTKHH